MYNRNYGYTNFLLQHKRNANTNNLRTNDIQGAVPLNQYDRKVQKMPEQVRTNKGQYLNKKHNKKNLLQRETKSSHSINRQQRSSHRLDRSMKRRPEKPVGKSQKKTYSNKVDLRFDVKDINNKKRKYYYPWEQREQRMTQDEKQYLMAQNRHKYSRRLPKEKIEKKVEYDYGDRNKSANNRLARSQLDRSKGLMKKEAYNVFQKMVILRDGPQLRKKQLSFPILIIINKLKKLN